MEINAHCHNQVLHIRLQGEIDEYSAARARRTADELAEKYASCKSAVFDLKDISFMDSTGIGFLIGRYKKFKKLGIPTYVANPTPSTDKILAISGIYTLIPKL